MTSIVRADLPCSYSCTSPCIPSYPSPIASLPPLQTLRDRLLDISTLSPSDAADLLMNTFYQNCDAADLPPYLLLKHGEMRGYSLKRHPWNGGSASQVVDLTKAVESQYYLQCPQNSKRKFCTDFCKTPPTYIWGGKGTYKKNGELNLFTNENSIEKISKHPGIDCSGYINAVFAIAGLKVRTDMKASKVASTTPAKWFMKESTCFDRVKFNDGLKAGDLISWRKHIVMIDKVSTDPFALDSVNNISQCNSRYIDPLKFKLIVSNSLGGINDENKDQIFSAADLFGDEEIKSSTAPFTGVGIGISKIPFGHLAMKYPVEIMELATSACLAKFGKESKWNKIHITRHKLADTKSMPANHECLETDKDKVNIEGRKCIYTNCNM